MEEVNWPVFQATAQMLAAQAIAGQTIATRTGSTDVLIQREFLKTYRALEQAAQEIAQGKRGTENSGS
ncbi:MAG: hypothetical protein O9331_14365 [Acidovorax sp.]|nr:hypothetical protein [Acidovorax sp.]